MTKKGTFMDILATVIGSMIIGAGVSFFTTPNNIAPGGFTGLATALSALIPLGVGAITFILNVPLLLASWKVLGKRQLVFALLSTSATSVFIELFDRMNPYTSNPLLAAVVGGAALGIGIGILMMRGISSGGTDLVALMVHKALPDVSLGSLLLIIDGLVVVFAVIVFKDINVALYSAVTIFVQSKVIDGVLQGVNYAKVVHVITDKPEEMLRRISEELDRGTTVLNAEGGYTGNEKKVILAVTGRTGLSRTIAIVKQCDPNAFVYVINAAEVHGEGFVKVG